MAEWQKNLLEDPRAVTEVLLSSRRIAVLGIKTEADPGQPAFYVPSYLQRCGFEIVPVPVYYPDATRILGQPVYRRLADIPGPVDLVNVFRRSSDIPPHLPDILEKRPRAVWFQSGIRNDAAAQTLAENGVLVVQDRCTMVEHRRAIR